MASLDEIFDATDPTTPGHYGASRTALLLLDFHTRFVNDMGGTAAPAATAVAAQLRTWAHAQGIPVIHNIIDLEQAPTPTCKGLERYAGLVATMRESGGGEEAAELRQPSDKGTDVTFLKRVGHVSALKSPGLEDFLRERGIVSLVLAGLSTSGCVLRTAFAASDAEFVVTVISDACADPKEGVHEFLIDKLLNNRGFVMTAAEFQQGFDKVTRKD